MLKGASNRNVGVHICTSGRCPVEYIQHPLRRAVGEGKLSANRELGTAGEVAVAQCDVDASRGRGLMSSRVVCASHRGGEGPYLFIIAAGFRVGDWVAQILKAFPALRSIMSRPCSAWCRVWNERVKPSLALLAACRRVGDCGGSWLIRRAPFLSSRGMRP